MIQRTAVQRIIHRSSTTTRYWKRYKNEHDQWITESGLPHARKVIEDY